MNNAQKISASLFDRDTQECPYNAYRAMRTQGPIYKDPVSGFYVVTRYDLLRRILRDTENFTSGQRAPEAAVMPQRVKRINEEFSTKGWLPGPSLGRYDDPDHTQVRAVFDVTFRAARIRELDPFVEKVAVELLDDFIEDGHCDVVRQYAVPLPMKVFAKQMGARDEELERIKIWTDAWVRRLGMMISEEEEMETVHLQIEAQHYFQPIIERLRREPDGTLFSDMVTSEVPGWGRPLNDNELHAHLMSDTFVGGSETTANALSAGVMLLIQNPGVWQKLKRDPGKYLKNFVEEVLRLESPVQGLTRYVANDVEIEGVRIPAGSMIAVQYAAANRDDEHFEEPDVLNLERKNAGSHMSFGSGIHHCLGAPLARRELYWGFAALVDRIDEMWFAEGKNDFSHKPNAFLRCLSALHIEFKKK